MELSTPDGPFGDIPTRPMRVKVLYTFDTENKTNCLARFPDTLQIPAVAVDENQQVGVIELRQCIQAIVSASPELLSRLAEGDFTIYAYDYSEYETPLVGQGMLSAALAAASTTPLAPAHQSKTMITGRVCKNLQALFSGGVKETLEVKLRLVPVPKQVQNEYVKSLESFRSMSPATSAGFDPNAWMQQSQQQNDYFSFDTGMSGEPNDQSAFEDIFGLGSAAGGSGNAAHELGGVDVLQTPAGPVFDLNPAFSHSAPGSRTGSPIMGQDSNRRNDLLRHQSFSANPSSSAQDRNRPGSRASVRSEVPHPSHHRQASQPSSHQQSQQEQTESYYNEDGQSRKRAKVTQTDWRGRSSFGTKSSDLRVTAATAASMQLHRPVAQRPSAPGSDLELPPRVPTPVPQFNPAMRQQGRPSTGSRSTLRHASTTALDFMSDIKQLSDVIISSPEEGSPGNSTTADGTPREIPSSPPVFPGIDQPQPSSPGLPTLPPPRMADSGYMSERGWQSSTFDKFDDNEDRSPDAHDFEMAQQYRSRSDKPQQWQQQAPFFKREESGVVVPPPYPESQASVLTGDMNIEIERPGDMSQLPQKMLLDSRTGKAAAPSAPRASADIRRRDGSQGPLKQPRPSSIPKRAAQAPPRIGSPAPLPSTENQATVQGSAPEKGFAPPLERPLEPPQSRRSSLALPTLPTKPASTLVRSQTTSNVPPHKPAAQKRQPIQRSRTISNESEAGSPAPSDTDGRPPGPRRSGSGAPRRKLIEQRLHQSVANGEMPPFCTHCGAIETPTWRRLYYKFCRGKPSPLDEAEGEGETIGVEALEHDEEDNVAKFMIRKSIKRGIKGLEVGDGWSSVQVCNPCGLWFNKFRNMRPPDKWGRKTNKRARRDKQASGPTTDGIEPGSEFPQSEAFFTDAPGPEEMVEEANANVDPQLDGAASEPTANPLFRRRRANSMQAQRRPSDGSGHWNAARRDGALERAIQSSPPRFHGSQESPIELGDTPAKPTRRLLFPSPRKEGETKSLDDGDLPSRKSDSPGDEGSAEKPMTSSKAIAALDGQGGDLSVFEAFTMDKENMPPPLDKNDELAHLFDGSPTALFKTPRKTPAKVTPRSNYVMDQLLKTPTTASRKRKPLTPNANAANNANLKATIADPNDFMTSPSSSRYFLRSTPIRLANTPGRHSAAQGGNSSQDTSPFSRHLAQIISDANETAAFTSPSRAFDFSDVPNFATPGRGMVDWEGLEGILSSEFGVYDENQGDAGAVGAGSGGQIPGGESM